MCNCRLAIAALGLGFAITTSAASPFEAAQNQPQGTTVVDAKGNIVGYQYFGPITDYLGGVGRKINGGWYTIPFNVLGFVAYNNFPGYAYTTPDCSGNAYLSVNTATSAPLVSVYLDPAPRAGSARTMGAPMPPPPPVTYKSSATIFFPRTP